MSRLIDADEFDSILADGEINARNSRKYVMESAINTIRGNLANMPTIEERKKAHWINVRDGNIADCGMCNARGRAWMNFCPVCGADMRGEQDG